MDGPYGPYILKLSKAREQTIHAFVLNLKSRKYGPFHRYPGNFHNENFVLTESVQIFSEEYFIEIISSFQGKESSLEVYENLVQVLSAKVAVKRSYYRLENI